MEPTINDIKVLKRTAYTMLGITIALAFLVVFMAAKSSRPEYRPIIIGTRSVTTATAYQPSLTRNVQVSVSVQIACVVSLSGGQAGIMSLQTSPDGVTYTTIAQAGNSSTGTLVVGLTLNNTNGSTLTATVVPGGFYKIVTASSTGTPTYSILTQAQEVQL